MVLSSSRNELIGSVLRFSSLQTKANGLPPPQGKGRCLRQLFYTFTLAVSLALNIFRFCGGL